jgi:hypothetical protein
MYESDVERSVIKYYEKIEGGMALKLVSPGLAGIPDRLGLKPVKNKRHREIVAKYVTFLELKRPGGIRKRRQERVAEMLKRMGYETEVVDRKKVEYGGIRRSVS